MGGTRSTDDLEMAVWVKPHGPLRMGRFLLGRTQFPRLFLPLPWIHPRKSVWLMLDYTLVLI